MSEVGMESDGQRASYALSRREGAVSLLRTGLPTTGLGLLNWQPSWRAALVVGLAINDVAFRREVVVGVGIDRGELL